MKKVGLFFITILLFVSVIGCSSKEKKNTVESSNKVVKVKEKEYSKTSESKTSTMSIQPSESVSQEVESEPIIAEPQGSEVAQEATGDWKADFEADLFNKYQVTVKQYVDYGNGYYGVFVNEFDTGENAYVTVNSATGNFHG